MPQQFATAIEHSHVSTLQIRAGCLGASAQKRVVLAASDSAPSLCGSELPARTGLGLSLCLSWAFLALSCFGMLFRDF